MEPDEITTLRNDAIAAARQIDDPVRRLRELTTFAPYAGDERDGLLDEAADLARQFTHPQDRAEALWTVFRAATR